MDKKLSRLADQGVILPTVLIITAVLMGIGFVLLSAVTGQYTLASDDVYTDNALQAAEAGVEQTVDQLNQGNNSFSGYQTPQTLFNNATQGDGTFVTTIVDSPDNSNAKIITSTGTIYHYGQTANPVSTRKVKVTVVGTQSQGYSVMTGPGGLILTGSAAITNSAVYVNGTISLSGTSSIGTQNQPLDVDAANYACPTTGGATWPQLCSGTQPISLGPSTHIYGTVCATGQASNSNITGGSTGSGLVMGCTAPQVSTPTYDRMAQINAVTTTGSGSSAPYKCNGNSTVSWPANLELTGDVSIGGSCKLTINGNVYITGSLEIGGAAQVYVADSMGTTRPVILVDGIVDAGGSGSLIANKSGTGIEFVSFKSSNACTTATGSSYCPTISGNDLFNSQSQTTVTVGGAVNLAGFVFDSYWGTVDISGSGNVGAAIGQVVEMSGAGTVTFGTSIGAGAETWTISSYQIVPNGST